MIYSSILLLLFFNFLVLHGTYSEIHKRCNSQDNTSKQTAFEKEPLTLEKDKEDQSKYYLSYPKPAVLDMKWKNRDINVIELANIPKFSKLDDIVTPLRLVELFFD